jgi:DNA-binding response OmpR family regulator
MENNKENNEQATKHILIVEDDTFMSSLLARKFSSENFKISAAANTQQAQEILEKENVNLVILDVVLPGTDGITFLKNIKANSKYGSVPVVIASNLGQPEEVKAGMNSGATDYIVKSNSSPGEIVEKVKSILEKRP